MSRVSASKSAEQRSKSLQPLLVNFRDQDTLTSVTRETLRLIAKALGLTETQTVHFALAKLRREVLPKYALDDGPVSDKTLRTIRKLVPQGDFTPTQSLFSRK